MYSCKKIHFGFFWKCAFCLPGMVVKVSKSLEWFHNYLFASGYFYPSHPSRSSNRKKKAVIIIIFHHSQHEDAQFNCSWWDDCMLDETHCYINSVNMRFPSLSQDIFHGNSSCWIRMSSWWVWSVSWVHMKKQTQNPIKTVMVGQCAQSLLRSWALPALIVWSVFTSRAQVLDVQCL